MKLSVKLFSLFLVALITVAMLQGCGKKDSECTAPDGSTITINPASGSWDTGGLGFYYSQPNDWQVVVRLSDGTPMAKACIKVSGNLAVPSTAGAYQFQFYPSDRTPNSPVNSGFEAQTDDSGQYTFSTLISAGSGTWKDSIYVTSGANMGTASLEVI